MQRNPRPTGRSRLALLLVAAVAGCDENPPDDCEFEQRRLGGVDSPASLGFALQEAVGDGALEWESPLRWSASSPEWTHEPSDANSDVRIVLDELSPVAEETRATPTEGIDPDALGLWCRSFVEGSAVGRATSGDGALDEERVEFRIRAYAIDEVRFSTKLVASSLQGTFRFQQSPAPASQVRISVLAEVADGALTGELVASTHEETTSADGREGTGSGAVRTIATFGE